MAKLLNGGLNQSTRIQDAQGMDKAVSKTLELGKDYRLFFPVTYNMGPGKPDIMVAAVPGRQLDYDKLGYGFYPLEDFEQQESGRITDKSGLTPYARVARILFDASYNRAVAAAEDEAKKASEQLGTGIDVSSLKDAIKQIDLDYKGDQDARILPKLRPMISGVKVLISTQVLIVPLSETGVPNFSNATTASLDLGSRKSAQLLNLLSNPDYMRAGSDYLEVGYSYKGKSKQDAGQSATFQGISNDTSIATKFATIWQNDGIPALARIAKSPEIIMGRNMSMSSRATSKEIVAKFNKWCAQNAIVLAYINWEEDDTKNAAIVMEEIGLGANMPKIAAQVKSLADMLRAYRTDEQDDTLVATEDLDRAIVEAMAKSGLGDMTATGGDDLKAAAVETDADSDELGSL